MSDVDKREQHAFLKVRVQKGKKDYLFEQPLKEAGSGACTKAVEALIEGFSI